MNAFSLAAQAVSGLPGAHDGAATGVEMAPTPRILTPLPLGTGEGRAVAVLPVNEPLQEVIASREDVPVPAEVGRPALLTASLLLHVDIRPRPLTEIPARAPRPLRLLLLRAADLVAELTTLGRPPAESHAPRPPIRASSRHSHLVGYSW